jgi:hypothetical protein
MHDFGFYNRKYNHYHPEQTKHGIKEAARRAVRGWLFFVLMLRGICNPMRNLSKPPKQRMKNAPHKRQTND